jgi:type I restriction enzyme M protein
MDLSNKFWQLCNQLRHDGIDSADYIEQLTYLLFLKMAEERGTLLPQGCSWTDLTTQKDVHLIAKLDEMLATLQKQAGLIGQIFEKPISRVDKVEGLKKMFKVLNSIEWTKVDTDVIGLAFEEIIGRVANDGKKGSGQYFTPRPLIQAIVAVTRPDALESSDFTVADVASGTAGFLIVAYEWLKNKHKKFKKADEIRVKTNTYFGQELVSKPRRLALMNMYLHGVEANIKLGDSIYEKSDGRLFSCILTNPPFGNKGGGDIPDRPDFKVKTADKQLNFIQHIINSLKMGGRAAIVLPDSVLSNDKAIEIWRNELQNINLHTILKLPRGTFAAYAAGIKACVLFFQKGVPTETTWVYDARANVDDVTKTSRPLSYEKHFVGFVKSYGTDANGKSLRVESERFKSFSLATIQQKNYDINFNWLKDDLTFDPENLPHPNELLDKISEEMRKMIQEIENFKKPFVWKS